MEDFPIQSPLHAAEAWVTGQRLLSHCRQLLLHQAHGPAFRVAFSRPPSSVEAALTLRLALGQLEMVSWLQRASF